MYVRDNTVKLSIYYISKRIWYPMSCGLLGPLNKFAEPSQDQKIPSAALFFAMFWF